jgi:hypothetical protein
MQIAKIMFFFAMIFYVKLMCILIEQMLFCCNQSSHENLLLQTTADAAWMCEVS